MKTCSCINSPYVFGPLKKYRKPYFYLLKHFSNSPSLSGRFSESVLFVQLVDYQLEVDKGKLTAVANLKSC